MAVNNTFIAGISGMRGAIDPMLLMPMLDKVTAYDIEGKVLVDWQ